MKPPVPRRHPLTERRIRFLATALTLGVFIAFATLVTLRLRADLRRQVLVREAESMLALVRLQNRLAADEWRALGVPSPDDDRFATLLQTTRLRGVVALRLYEPTGQLRESLPAVGDAMLSLADWPGLESGRAQARLRWASTMDAGLEEAHASLPSEPEVRLLEVLVPLEEAGGAGFGGVAQYLMDGGPVEAELARIDRGLLQQAVLATLGGVGVIGALLVWAFGRLSEASRRLQGQREDLARANQELAFAARTSAVGAISAHLIHGLSNPLSGLEGFVQAGPSAAAPEGGDEWRAAAETTRRLRTLVNEVVAVLRDEATGLAFTTDADAVVREARDRVAREADQAGVSLVMEVAERIVLGGRTANLAGLVLRNLLHNAIEAAPPGSMVRLRATRSLSQVEFSVSDQGPGLPATVRGALFQPVRSGKSGGGGIGLALSHHLARHAGGRLELVESTDRGTVFRLVLPSDSRSGASLPGA